MIKTISTKATLRLQLTNQFKQLYEKKQNESGVRH